MLPLFFLIRQRSEAHKRIKIAENFGNVAQKWRSCGCRGSEFQTDNPRQYLLPILRGCGPAVVFRPLSLYGCVPVAFVAPPEALLLLGSPTWIRNHTRLCDQRECGFLAFPTRIDTEARRNSIHCEAHIELAGFAFSRCVNGEFKVHVRLVQCLVLRESDVPVEPRKILASAASGVKARIEFQSRGRKFLQ